MKTKLLIFGIAVLCLSAGPAMAAIFGPLGPGPLQGVLDGITTAPVAGSSSVNVSTDEIPDVGDSYWSITASGGSVNTFIVELAGFAAFNTFGVYDSTNPANKVQIFAGGDTAGAQKMLSIDMFGNVYVQSVILGNFASGNHFGYYIDSSTFLDGTNNPAGGVFYSDTALNIDGLDHMYAYQGKNIDTVQIPPWSAGLWTDDEYVFAFEDLLHLPPQFVSDRDYTDVVVMIESIVPVPGAVILGILGLGVASLKLRKYA